MKNRTAVAVFMGYNVAISKAMAEGALEFNDGMNLLTVAQEVTERLLRGEEVSGILGMKKDMPFRLSDDNIPATDADDIMTKLEDRNSVAATQETIQ